MLLNCYLIKQLIMLLLCYCYVIELLFNNTINYAIELLLNCYCYVIELLLIVLLIMLLKHNRSICL